MNAAKLSTADCQKYLVEKIADNVAAMYNSPNDIDSPEDRAYGAEIEANARNPKKWKRMTKYNVGSDIDKGEKDAAEGGYGGMNYWEQPQYAGGIVRTFYLEGTDHITYNLIEVNGQIIEAEDFSD